MHKYYGNYGNYGRAAYGIDRQGVISGVFAEF